MTQKKSLRNPTAGSEEEAAEVLLKIRTELESLLVQRTADLERLEGALVEVADRESQRLGQELHDTLCQQLLGAAFCAEALAQRNAPQPDLSAGLRELSDLIHTAVQQARQITRGLEPNLNDSELASALNALVAKVGRGMKASLECPKPVPIPRLETAVHIYRIAQEAISNAQKHSGGSQLTVRLYEGKKNVFLEVEDDGCGSGDSLESSARIGLTLMRIRARAISAKLVFQTAKKGGTCVQCVVPK